MVFGCFTYCLVMFNIYPVTCFVLVGLTSREKKTNFENGITFDTWNHRGEGEKSEMISTAIEKTEGCIFTWLYDYLFSFTV